MHGLSYVSRVTYVEQSSLSFSIPSSLTKAALHSFQLATKVTKFFIEHFGRRDLFGRDNYEYYARLTGRILKVEDEYIFFTYPPAVSGHHRSRDDTDASLDRLGRGRSESPVGAAAREEGTSAAAGPLEKTGSLEIIPENCPLDPAGRLSISLDDQNVSSPSSCGSPSGGGGVAAIHHHHHQERAQTLGRPSAGVGAVSPVRRGEAAELRMRTGKSAAEVKSYTCLPQVNARETSWLA